MKPSYLIHLIRVLLLNVGIASLVGCHEDMSGEDPPHYKTVAEKNTSISGRCADLVHTAEPHEAVAVCLQEASQGNLAAEVLLGDLYAKSYQWNDAMEWYETAAKHGAPYAQLQIAMIYLEGKGVRKDIRQALSWIVSSAKLDYSPSQLMLAKLYHEGKLIEKNDYLAFEWYLACAKDQSEAAFQVGIAYMTGQLNQPKNLELAIPYLNHAAEKQHESARMVLEKLALEGKQTDPNFEKSIEYYRKEAKKGSHEAQLNLAKALMQFSIPQYDKAAFYWATQSASRGNEEAKYLLGQFYYEGIGIPVNYDKAFEIFNDMALSGHSLSQYRLGKMYCEGHGIEQDDYLGKKWIMSAAEQGVEEAQTMVEIWEKEPQLDHDPLEREYSHQMPIDARFRDELSENQYESSMGPH